MISFIHMGNNIDFDVDTGERWGLEFLYKYGESTLCITILNESRNKLKMKGLVKEREQKPTYGFLKLTRRGKKLCHMLKLDKTQT